MIEPEGNPPLKTESSFEFVSDYFRKLREILFEPALFFKNLAPTGGMSGPLAFALVTHWIGSSVNYFLSTFLGDPDNHLYNRMVQFSSQFSGQFPGQFSGDIDSPGRANQHFMNMMGAGEKLLNWIWGASSVLLDPFYTLFFLLLSAFFVFIGARIFFTYSPESQTKFPRGPTFESTVRILSFAMAPAIFSGVPYLGTLVAKLIYIPIVTIIGAREVYRVSNGRAVLIALFPDLLIWGILVLGALVIAIFFMSLASRIFM